jgi:glutamate carboxypeptidase
MSSLSSPEQDCIERARTEPMLEQVEAWAAVNSGSRNLAGLGVVAGQIADAFAALPGDVTLVDPAPVDEVDAAGRCVALEHGRNLHLKVRPEVPVQLLLTGHMDTVFAADHPFQALTWLDDRELNGPGVADMKGGIAVMLAALKAVEASEAAPRLGYEVIINSDEEVGSAGSGALIASSARGKRAALTYEPSALPDGTLAGARPGSGNFSFIVRGRSAHAGRNPKDGRNAVVAAALLAIRLTELAREGLNVNVAKIDGGGPNNVVPDNAVLRVNMRPASQELERYALDAMHRAIESIRDRIKVEISVHGSFSRPPKPMTPEAEALFNLVKQAGADLGQAIGWQATGGVCDGNNIAACGVPVVDTMGVRGGKIHSAEEYLIVDSLNERAALSALTLLRLADGRS